MKYTLTLVYQFRGSVFILISFSYFCYNGYISYIFIMSAEEFYKTLVCFYV